MPHRRLPRPADRVAFVADLAANWARLRRTPAPDRRVALILANYPNKDGRLANGVGLDTPAATVHVLRTLREAGYAVEDLPADADALMRAILAGPTNWLADRARREGGVRLPLAAYREAYARLPVAVREQVEARWGPPEADPFLVHPHAPAPAADASLPPRAAETPAARLDAASRAGPPDRAPSAGDAFAAPASPGGGPASLGTAPRPGFPRRATTRRRPPRVAARPRRRARKCRRRRPPPGSRRGDDRRPRHRGDRRPRQRLRRTSR